MWTLFLLESLIASPHYCVHPFSTSVPVAWRRSKQSTETPGEPPSSVVLHGTYEDTDRASQGLVSTLTTLVNTFLPTSNNSTVPSVEVTSSSQPPTTPDELCQRIAKDYTENNYLWTGNLDVACFAPDCQFTDPTLSFQGTDTFCANVQNLVPLVQAALGENGTCCSDLLSISLVNNNSNHNYVETRWNMVGDLRGLPWKPRIDVIGRTKFWFEKEKTSYRVIMYDEEWEIPAWKALLQLVTRAGTISNSEIDVGITDDDRQMTK